jgi:hypothetical protein
MSESRTQKMSLLRGAIEDIPGLVDAPTSEPVATNKLWWDNGVLKKSVGIPPVITDQPDDITIEENLTATFSLTATNATSYQWQRNIASVWTNVGTNSNTYTTPVLTLADSGRQHRCVVTGPGGSVTSAGHASAFVTQSLPRQLFAGGYQGDHWDAFTLGDLFQLSGGTTAVTADNQPVGYVKGKVNSNHLIQATTEERPIYRTSGSYGYLDFYAPDNHHLIVASSTGLFKFLHDGTGGTLLIACRPGAIADPDTLYGFASTSSATSANIGMILGWDDRVANSRSNGLIVGVYNGSTNIISLIPNDVFTANTDGVVALTFGTAQTPDFDWRVNGSSIGTSNVLATASTANSTHNFTIGGLGGQGASSLTGRVYAVLAINRVLTPTEISNWSAWVNQRIV